MDFRQLEYFVTVAAVGHFTRAAAELHVGQPALSQAVRRLEAEIGSDLIVRGTHPLRLTAAGETLLPLATRAVSALEDARNEFGLCPGEPTSRLTLGVLRTIGPLEALITSFHRLHPAVEIVLREHMTLEIIDELLVGHLDIGVTTLVPDLPAELRHLSIFSEPLVLMAPPGAFTGSEISLADLHGEPLLAPPAANGVRVIIEQAFREAGVAPRIVMETNDFQRQRLLVSEGLGSGIVPLRPGPGDAPPVDHLTIVDGPERNVALMWRGDRRHSSTVRAFLQHAQTAVDAGLPAPIVA